MSGAIAQFAQQRLMHGNSGSPNDVAALMAGEKADLVVTSPPYARQRTYGASMESWDYLMRRVCKALPVHSGTQMLVNLGMVYEDGEWFFYWRDWLQWIKAMGWKHSGFYVWDKLNAFPGGSNRFQTAHEFIFHFSRSNPFCNAIVPCKHAGKAVFGNIGRLADGSAKRKPRQGKPVAQLRVHDSVIRLSPAKGNLIDHPAVYPVSLPSLLIRSFSQNAQRVLDPFAGSGTTLVAAHALGRRGYGMEINDTYFSTACTRMKAACKL